jgi:hypothetical protein
MGYIWNDVVFLCVDENGCPGAPCNNVEHALRDSCSDVQAPFYGFDCKCEAGFKWDPATTSCVGKQCGAAAVSALQK